MAKFKVGDRVSVKLVGSPLWREYYGRQNKAANVVAIVVGEYCVKLDTPEYCDDGHWYANEREIEPLPPAVPDGWTPASEPPDSDRNVRVILDDGRVWYAWYGNLKDLWHIYKSGASIKLITENPTVYYDNFRNAAPGEVIAWREIEPEPEARARYSISYGDGWECDDERSIDYDTPDKAIGAAKETASNTGEPVRVWKLIAIVNPGKPEVIRIDKE